MLGRRRACVLGVHGRRFPLDRRETGWLLAELAPRDRAAEDPRAVVAGMRIEQACRSGRGRQVSLSDEEATAVLTALDRGEQRGQLTAGLHALQLALREPHAPLG